MTKLTVKLTSNNQPKLIRQFHSNFPSNEIDSHLIYCLYITIQNLIHLHVTYIFLFHATFWLNANETKNESIEFIEKTEYEQTHFIFIQDDYNNINRTKLNVHLINKYVYITLFSISIIELISSFLWKLQKKLLFSLQRNQKWKNLLRLLLIGFIFSLYLLFFFWILFHTFITHYLSVVIFIIILSHFLILIFLDKPNLFYDTSSRIYSMSNPSHKFSRRCSSITLNPMNRFSFRSLTSIQSRKMNSLFLSLFSPLRWLSVSENQFHEHQCSTFYSDIREEVDHLCPIVLRRTILQFYHMFSSSIFFDLIPYKTMERNLIPIDLLQFRILIFIFALNTFLSHSIFLFPTKFQINLHYLSNHLGQWRLKSYDRTNSIDEWSPECNKYIRGNIIKFSSNYFIALQQISNAAHPQSISHSIFYRLFHNIRYCITIQFFLCLILIFCQVIWIIPGHYAFEILISILIILNSSYTIFKIIRNRLIFDMFDEYESDQYLLTSNEKKIKLNK